MRRSAERILTTHAGSLPRPRSLLELMVALSRREPVDAAALARESEAAVRLAVRRQREAGIDVGNDGEQGRESFVTYVQHRLEGFGGESQRPVMRDLVHFPSFLELRLPDFSRRMVNLLRAPQALAAVRHRGTDAVAAECARFARVAQEEGDPFAERFLTAASPGIVACVLRNAHYRSDEEYLAALAEALRPEYDHVLSQGLVLQLDAPDLAMERHTSWADRPLPDFLAAVERHVAALNRALRDLPADRLRLHVCWGNYQAPHLFDVALEEILPRLYQARVGALMLPFANPRHAHEWRRLAQHPLPADMLLVAGVIDTTTNYVEHPELVAERIERVAEAVGDPTRVLAGTDCGFDTAAGLRDVAEEVVWEKLRSLRDGAALATRRLFPS